MPRMAKFAFFAVMTFSGVVLTFTRVHFWVAARHMTRPTYFDTVRTSGENDDLSWGIPDPWFEKGLVVDQTAAAAKSFLGVPTFCWAVVPMRSKGRPDSFNSPLKNWVIFT